MSPLTLFLLTAALLVMPGLWLALRRQSGMIGIAAATVLLLAATAAAYIGLRLWQEELRPNSPPLALTAAPGHFQTIRPDQLPAALALAAGRPVLLEFYADWCPSCIVWKQEVFSRPDVQAALAPVVLLQVDATELTPEAQALLERYGLAGLPALLAFNRQGQEQPDLRLLGEMSAPDFLRWIETRFLPAL